MNVFHSVYMHIWEEEGSQRFWKTELFLSVNSFLLASFLLVLLSLHLKVILFSRNFENFVLLIFGLFGLFIPSLWPVKVCWSVKGWITFLMYFVDLAYLEDVAYPFWLSGIQDIKGRENAGYLVPLVQEFHRNSSRYLNCFHSLTYLRILVQIFWHIWHANRSQCGPSFLSMNHDQPECYSYGKVVCRTRLS